MISFLSPDHRGLFGLYILFAGITVAAIGSAITVLILSRREKMAYEKLKTNLHDLRFKILAQYSNERCAVSRDEINRLKADIEKQIRCFRRPNKIDIQKAISRIDMPIEKYSEYNARFREEGAGGEAKLRADLDHELQNTHREIIDILEI